jgi:hypothetical protein
MKNLTSNIKNNKDDVKNKSQNKIDIKKKKLISQKNAVISDDEDLTQSLTQSQTRSVELSEDCKI